MNTMKTGFLLATLTLILVAFGGLADRVFGLHGFGIIIMFGFSIIMNWVAYFYSDKMVLKSTGAQIVDRTQAPELYDMVERLAQRAGLPMPKVAITPEPVPNAFATGRNPAHAAVACTEGILQALPKDELEGVIAHELAHIKHRDTLTQTVAATLAGAIGMVSQIGMFGGFGRRDGEGSNPLFGVLMVVFALLAPFVTLLIQMAISRTREFEADRAAAEMTGNPDGLSNALRRIEAFAQGHQMQTASAGTSHMYIINPFSASGLKTLFSTHPPTEQRIAALDQICTEMQNSGLPHSTVGRV